LDNLFVELRALTSESVTDKLRPHLERCASFGIPVAEEFDIIELLRLYRGGSVPNPRTLSRITGMSPTQAENWRPSAAHVALLDFVELESLSGSPPPPTDRPQFAILLDDEAAARMRAYRRTRPTNWQPSRDLVLKVSMFEGAATTSPTWGHLARLMHERPHTS
jgi:hypothetical protein